MSTSLAHRVVSPLDNPPRQFAGEPFYGDTLTLLRSVRDHDFSTLAHLCDDDFGIVDVDPEGNARPIRTRTEWEHWFHELFATLDAMHARTDSIVLDYHAVRTPELGYSVLDFRQMLEIGTHTATFDCVATIVWKHTEHGWREARWHASVISASVPPELSAAA